MKRNGFTLIELMIVLAILGIIGSILLPYFGKSDVTTSSASVQGQVIQTRSSLQCKNGFLFRVHGDGTAEPATDADTNTVGAPKC
jgi:prepilin-type N-terminal cleavage/methylation domain-containing protein